MEIDLTSMNINGYSFNFILPTLPSGPLGFADEYHRRRLIIIRAENRLLEAKNKLLEIVYLKKQLIKNHCS